MISTQKIGNAFQTLGTDLFALFNTTDAAAAADDFTML